MGENQSASPDGFRGPESKIILIPLQIAVSALTASYLLYMWSELRRRKRRSWQGITNRFSPLRSDPAAMEIPLRSRHCLALYRDAGVMMEIADYAECNAHNPDQVLIDGMRSDALHIRLNALKILLIRTP